MTTNDTPTPRTDSVLIREPGVTPPAIMHLYPFGPVVTADFARALEREIVALREALRKITAAFEIEKSIVSRIWEIYENPSYESLNGKSIYDLINEDRERLADAERDVELSTHERALHNAHQQRWLMEKIKVEQERDSLAAKLREAHERVSWLEKQREVECRQKEAALKESDGFMAELREAQAANAELQKDRDRLDLLQEKTGWNKSFPHGVFPEIKIFGDIDGWNVFTGGYFYKSKKGLRDAIDIYKTSP